MKKFYNEQEAMEHFGISGGEIYSAVKDGQMEVFENERGTFFHWSDLIQYKISLKGNKGESSANFGLKEAAKYLGISVNELKCYTDLGWVEFIVFKNGRKIYFEEDLDVFILKVLAPISKIV